jgi:two-component system phosphate regulon response regulator OmpR
MDKGFVAVQSWVMNSPKSVPEEGFAERPHILVVDDDDRIRDLVARYLADHGFVAGAVANAAEAREILAVMDFDALVVDVMMPGETGFEFTQSMRAAGYTRPIMLLTALGESGDRITGLETGADDYLPKPFEPRELVLRLQAILRRVPMKKNATLQPIRIGRWMYHPDLNRLIDGEIEQSLTTAEATLMRALVSCAGEVISREDLVRLCAMDDTNERTIDVQVTRLRRKIEDDARAPRYLQTVRGKGYLLRTGP